MTLVLHNINVPGGSPMKSGAIYMEINALHRHGWTVSALAREFGLSRLTVRREIASGEPRRYPERARAMALNEAQAAHVGRRLEACPEIRGTTLFHELRRDYGYAGSYPTFIRQLRRLRDEQKGEPVIRFETDPGHQTQVDWADLGKHQVGGQAVEVYALVAILGASRAPAMKLTLDRTRGTTLSAVIACLEELGGVTTEILTDRDPAFCIGSTGDGRAILAPEWVDLCGLMGTVPRACRPYRAQTKGKVERMIREVKEDFLPWLSGQVLPLTPTLDDYERFFGLWRSEIVLPRRHRTTKQIVGQAWEAERPLLCPLPPGLPRPHAIGPVVVPPGIIDLASRKAGDQVEVRDLAEYEVAL